MKIAKQTIIFTALLGIFLLLVTVESIPLEEHADRSLQASVAAAGGGGDTDAGGGGVRDDPVLTSSLVCDPPCTHGDICFLDLLYVDFQGEEVVLPSLECDRPTISSIPGGPPTNCSPACDPSDNCVRIQDTPDADVQYQCSTTNQIVCDARCAPNPCDTIDSGTTWVCLPPRLGPNEQIWWRRVRESFAGNRLKMCMKRGDVPPQDGRRCAARPKTCFFGTQQCPNGPRPSTRCFCDGKDATRTWSCAPQECPTPGDEVYQ